VTRVDDLLAAPRGRSLCAAMLREQNVFESLGRAVAFAAYWQEPLDLDDTEVPDDVLRPAAEAILRSPDIDWWRSPVHLADQWQCGRKDRPLSLDPGEGLGQWTADERAAVHAPNYLNRDDVSGTWWSAPIRLPSSTRSLAGRGPLGLWLAEDETGERSARCWPVGPTREPRVFEVHGPEDWAQLARTYAFDVTDSRSPDWKRATGRVGLWVVPNWPAVAADYDAVHVSTWGWLTTAGRPVPVNGAASLLAGWSPDQTYWLTDCLRVAGDPVDYERDPDGWWPARPPA